MTGKWHAGNIPVNRGFDRYFGLCDGCCNFWNPGPRREGEPEPGRKRYPRRWAVDDKQFRPYKTTSKDFYTTDAFTDYAVKYLDQYGRVLRSEEEVGRRLEFLIQEMLREANTIGAKSADVEMSHLCVDLKVELDRLKEQVQNVE